MKRIITLTENDLTRIVKKVLLTENQCKNTWYWPDYENNKNPNQFVILNDISYVELMKKILNYFYSLGIWMYDGEDCMMIY